MTGEPWCEGKEAFDKPTADKVANRMRMSGKRVEVYRCTTCGHWHIGTVLTGRLRRVRKLRKFRKGS